MKRIKVPAGTAQKFEDVFEKLQDFNKSNVDARINSFTDGYGLNLSPINGVVDQEEWRTAIVDSALRRIRIYSSGGKAKGITKGLETISLAADFEFNITTPDPAKLFCVISAQWEYLQSDPLPVINGFLYNPTGAATTINTVYSDRTQIKVTKWATMDEAVAAVTGHAVDRIPLAIVKVHDAGGSELALDPTWTGVEYSGPLTLNSANGVVDVRNMFVFYEQEGIHSDQTFLFKDRDSTDASNSPIAGKVTFKDHVHVDEDLTLSTDKSLGIGFSETDDITAAQVHIKGGQGLGTFKLEQTAVGWASKLYLKNATNEWAIYSDASPDELRIGRYTANGMTGVGDLRIDGTDGSLSVTNKLTAESDALIQGTLHVNNTTTLSTGTNFGIGFSEGGVPDAAFHLKGNHSLLIENPSTTAQATLQLKGGGSSEYSWKLLLDPSTNQFRIGRSNSTDFYIDSSGDTYIVNDLYVTNSANFDIGGNFTVKDNIKVDPSTETITLGDAVSGASLTKGVEIYYPGVSTLSISSDLTGAGLHSATFAIEVDGSQSPGTTKFKTGSDLLFTDATGASTLMTIDASSSNVDISTLTAGTWQTSSNNDQTAIMIDQVQKLEWGSSSLVTPTIIGGSTAGEVLNLGVNATYLNGSFLQTAQDGGAKQTIGISLDTSIAGEAQFGVYINPPGNNGLRESDKQFQIFTDKAIVYSDLYVNDGEALTESNIITSAGNTSRLTTLESAAITTNNLNSQNIVVDRSINSESVTSTSLQVTGQSAVAGHVFSSNLLKAKENVAIEAGLGEASRLFLTDSLSGWSLSTNLDTGGLDVALSSYDYTLTGIETTVTGVVQTIDQNVASFKPDGTIVAGALTVSGLVTANTLSTDSLDTDHGNFSRIQTSTIDTGHIAASSSNISNATTGNLVVTSSLDLGDSTITVVHNDTSYEGHMARIVASGVYIGDYHLPSAVGIPPGPANFRIWDIYPTTTSSEEKAFVHLRWEQVARAINTNYLPSIGGSTIRLDITANASGETFVGVDPIMVEDKRLKLIYPGGTSIHLITDYASATGEITVAEPFTATDATATVCQIIGDHSTHGYELKIEEWDSSASAPTGYTIVTPLDGDFVYNPSYIVKLDLNRTWKFSLKAVNYAHSSAYVAMQVSTYDPIHTGEQSRNYGSPVSLTLPEITSTASLALEASPLGFNINIAGDAWQDITTTPTTARPQNSAHNYEVIYSESADPSFDAYDGVVHLTTQNTFIPVASNIPKQWYVKARPLQNGQPVLINGISNSIVGGGGGVSPGDQMIFQVPTDTIVISGGLSYVEPAVHNVMYMDNAYVSSGVEITTASTSLPGEWLNIYSASGVEEYGDYVLEQAALPNGRMLLGLNSDYSTLQSLTDTWAVGTSKKSREIHRENLSVDFIITSITLNCTSATGVSANNPGIIRVYKEGYESSAAILEVENVGANTQTVSLSILGGTADTRTVIVDAYDPASANANNTCTMKGTLTISGRPKISTSGATA